MFITGNKAKDFVFVTENQDLPINLSLIEIEVRPQSLWTFSEKRKRYNHSKDQAKSPGGNTKCNSYSRPTGHHKKNG